MSFHCQFKETYKLASYKLLLLKRVRPVITEYTALTIVKSMLLPYLDMGNLFLSSQTQNDLSKLDVILNTALRSVYNVRIAREVHMLEIYTRANIFPLKYRRNYFVLNLMHRLLTSGQVEQQTVHRVTRQNVAPLLQQYVPANDTIAKSPVYVARDLWNSLPAATRNITDHESFKTTVRNMVKTDYIEHEEAKLLPRLF